LHQDNIQETFHNARQLLSSIDGPTLFGSSACPKSLRREFVAAWWGVTSISPRTQRARCCSSSLCRSIHRATHRELSATSPMRPLIHDVFRCHHVATIASPSGVGLDLRNRCKSFFHFFDTIGTRYSPSLSHEMTLLNLFFRSTLNPSMLENERFENDDTCFATAQSLFDDFFARYLVTFPNANSPTLLMPILSVEPLPEPLPVYDLSVPQHRNFVVSSVVVHNCDECMFVGICDACSHAACRDCMISPDQQLEPCFECNSVSCKKCIFDGKMPSRMRCYDCGSVFCVTCVRKKKSLVRRRCESETCDRKHWLCAKEHRRQKDMLMHPPGMKLEAVQQHNAQLCQHHHHQQQEILAMMQVSHASSAHSSPTRQQGQHPLLPSPSSVSAVAPQPQAHPHTHTAGRHHDHGHRHDSPRTHSPTPGGHVHDADCSHAPPPPSAAHAKLGLEEILTQMGLGNLKNRLFNDGLRITNIHLLKEHDLLDYGIQPAAASTALSELTAILQSYPSLFPSYAPPDPALSAAPHRHASQRQPRAPSVPTHLAPVARPALDPVAPAATSSHTADAIPKLTPVPLIDRIADRKRYPELNSNTIKYSKCDGCTAVKQCLFHCDFLPLSLSSSSSTFSSSSSGKETTTPKM
ncbi:MAG: hypothetical protein Q8P67_18235, partial [archaeon]|nr:hypothetical protein [archaeon]